MIIYIIAAIYAAMIVRLVLGYARFRGFLILLSLIAAIAILAWPAWPGLFKAIAILAPFFVGLLILGIALLIIIRNDKNKIQ